MLCRGLSFGEGVRRGQAYPIDEQELEGLERGGVGWGKGITSIIIGSRGVWWLDGCEVVQWMD